MMNVASMLLKTILSLFFLSLIAVPAFSAELPAGAYWEELVPIIYYHGIGSPDSNYTVKTEDFIRQMDYLRDNRYRTITFSELVGYMSNGIKPPEKAVVLTFDDGWSSQYDTAFPIMKERGFVGTFNIVTKYVLEDYEGYMNASQVKELHDAGMEIGVHSKTHANLTAPNADYSLEISEAYDDIRTITGSIPKTFVYPYGGYNTTVMDLVKSAGFSSARAIGKEGVSNGKNDPRVAHLKIKNLGLFYNITAQEIRSTTTMSDSSWDDFVYIVKYRGRNEVEDMYMPVSGSVSIGNYGKDSFSSVRTGGTAGDSFYADFIVPETGVYNITIRSRTGQSFGRQTNLERSYQYYLDDVPYDSGNMTDVNDAKYYYDDEPDYNITWGFQRIANVQLEKGFHKLVFMQGNNTGARLIWDYFTVEPSAVAVVNTTNQTANQTTNQTIENNTSLRWSSNQTASNNGSFSFSIKWESENEIDFVLMEGNHSGALGNYTMLLLSGNGSSGTWVYNDTMPAGDFVFRSLAKSFDGNWSASDSWGFLPSAAGNETNRTEDNNTVIINPPVPQPDNSGGGSGSSGGGSGSIMTKSIIASMISGKISKISVTLKKELSNPSIIATELDTVPNPISAGHVYKYLNVAKVSFKDSDIDGASIEFKVDKNWIRNNNISKVYLERYDNSWQKLKTELIKSDNEYNTYSATTNGFSYFAVVGEKPLLSATQQKLSPPQQHAQEQQTSKASVLPQAAAPTGMLLGLENAALAGSIAGVAIIALAYYALRKRISGKPNRRKYSWRGTKGSGSMKR